MITTASSFAAFLQGNAKLTAGAVADFGLDGGRPFGHLNTDILKLYQIGWINKKFTAEDLEEASCSGRRLTKLLQRFNPRAQIKTVWDNMTNNDLEEQKG